METYVFTIHGEPGTTSKVTASSLLISGHICSGTILLYYQEIKFGKESETAPKGFELSVCLSVNGDFFFLFGLLFPSPSFQCGAYL